MHPIAQKSDFDRLPEAVREAHLDVLQTCERNRLSCRCEMVGRDFSITIARGLSSAKYWIDLFAGQSAN